MSDTAGPHGSEGERAPLKVGDEVMVGGVVDWLCSPDTINVRCSRGVLRVPIIDVQPAPPPSPWTPDVGDRVAGDDGRQATVLAGPFYRLELPGGGGWVIERLDRLRPAPPEPPDPIAEREAAYAALLRKAETALRTLDAVVNGSDVANELAVAIENAKAARDGGGS